MAVTTGLVHSVQTLKSDFIPPAASAAVPQSAVIQLAEILFTMNAGTYAQANNSILASVNLLIQNSRRNGKVVTVLNAMASQQASNLTDQTKYFGTKTHAVVPNGANFDVTFEITDNSPTTEFADATPLVATDRPYGMVVAFYEVP